MKGISNIVSTIALVAIVVSLSVVMYFTTMQILSNQTPALSRSTPSSSIVVEAASITTPYTWKVYLHNLGKESLSLEGASAYLYDGKELCGSSRGFVSDKNVLQPGETLEVIFYGFNRCLTDSYTLKVSVGPHSYTTNAKGDVPEFWVDFAQPAMEKTGKHAYFYDYSYRRGSDVVYAIVHGLHPGSGESFDWANDITDGKKGEALEFNLDAKTRVTTSDVIIEDANVGTVSLWFRPNVEADVADAMYLFDANLDGNRYYIRFDNVNDKFQVSLCGVSFDITSSVLQSYWTPGKWTHVLIEWNTNIPEVRAYLNGDLVYRGTSAVPDCRFGNLAVGSANPTALPVEIFDGSIDEFRVYNRYLTEEEVKSLVRGEDVRNGLALYYSFDRNTINVDTNTVHDIHMWTEDGLYLDGNRYVEIPGGVGDISGKSFTLVAKIVPWEVPSEDRIVISDQSDEIGLVVTSGSYKAKLIGGNDVIGGTVSVDKETLLVAVYTYKDGNYSVKLYVDGEFMGENGSTTNPLAGEEINPLVIGYDPDGGPLSFKGIVKEVRVYSRALDEKDILCLTHDEGCLTDDSNLLYMLDFTNPKPAWNNTTETIEFNWEMLPFYPRLNSDSTGRYLDTNADTIVVLKDVVLYETPVFTQIVVAREKDVNVETGATKLSWIGRYVDSTHALALGFGVEDNAPGGSNEDSYTVEVWTYDPSTPDANKYGTSGSNATSLQIYAITWDGERRELGFYVTGNLQTSVVNTPYKTIFECSPVDECGTFYPFNTLLSIGGESYGLGSRAYADIYLVLGVDRKLSKEELDAICKLFGLC